MNAVEHKVLFDWMNDDALHDSDPLKRVSLSSLHRPLLFVEHVTASRVLHWF